MQCTERVETKSLRTIYWSSWHLKNLPVLVPMMVLFPFPRIAAEIPIGTLVFCAFEDDVKT
jgi:hypothetical protein